MRITAPMGTEEYTRQMEQLAGTGGMPPLAMANIAAPMPQHQQAPAPIIQQPPGVMGQAKDMFVDKALDVGMEKVMDTTAGTALAKLGASAGGPIGMIAGQVAGEFLPQLLKKGFRLNEGGHIGPLGAKYYSVGTPALFGDAYADPGKAASLSSSADRANLSTAVNNLSKVDRPAVGSDIQSSGGFGGLLSGLFNSPVFAPLSNLVSGVSEWAGEAFPAAESSAAAKAISAEANKGKNPIGADSWTWNVGNRNFTTMTPAASHALTAAGKPGGISDWQYMQTLKNTGGSPYKGFKGNTKAAPPGAQGATPIYNKKTDKTNWVYKNKGGKVQYYSPGSAPYRGQFNKPTTSIPIMESVKAQLEKPATGIQNIINKAPKARVVTPNALSIAPKFMGPLGTITGVLNPTQAAVATRDPVDAAPMGLEAEMFERQAALNEAKKRASREMFMEESGIGGINTDALQEAYEAGLNAAKQGVKDAGTWVMPKVIDRVEGLMNLLGPLAPKEKKPVSQVPMVYET